MREHVSAGEVRQHEINVGIILETKLHVDAEREPDRFQNALLVEGVLDLLLLHDFLLHHYFDGIVFPGGFVLGEHLPCNVRYYCRDSGNIGGLTTCPKDPMPKHVYSWKSATVWVWSIFFLYVSSNSIFSLFR